uniref:SprT-like N-terminal domain n=1 Tax=Cyprinus carpio TaxID=7962 RepID=A0A8C1VYS3_CYPCA
MEDEDFLLALRLQEQFDQETRALSVVDESWEVLDPSPDVRAMFLQFNDRFFWGKLSGVEVKWSPRMTLCAGVCSYEGRGGLCSIRLSEPLLKLRPRRDLVQTLLHEMIHALLFVTQNNRDRDGHGPEFCKHMDRINQASGANITIYHSFHDEVDMYRQHWWRCNGPCQNRRPFFGYVKRAMNRPPSARDPWWAEHQKTCGGTYTKIKEPENYGKTGKGDKRKDKNPSDETSKNAKPPSSTTGDPVDIPTVLSLFFFLNVANHCQHFRSFSQNFHGPQNILFHEYLNMQYVKRKNRASAKKSSILNN